MRWAGVDVGGRRKGFHAVVVDTRELVAGPVQLRSARDTTAWLLERGVDLVAVDSPIEPAPEGRSSRAEERDLCRAVCGIRYTPDRAGLRSNPAFYEWIEHGFELYDALRAAGLACVECFPTASWTRWFGARGSATRAGWTAAALTALAVPGASSRMSQDARDSIGAALTARAVSLGAVERFGPIAVPTA